MAECVAPFQVTNDLNEKVMVPCGQCPNCRKRRASWWSFRLMQEMKQATSAWFLTLTYDTSHVHITPAGFMGCRKKDLQDFFKRLRWLHSGSKASGLKYYAVGEYGETSWRPHYHVILFNAKKELIQPAWSLGHIHYGDVNEASVGYTLKYISKPGRIPLHRNDDRQREFSCMSKGLGKNYLTKEMLDWHLADPDNRMYCTLKDGKKIAMPRYYKQKIYSDEERKRIGIATRERTLDSKWKEIEKQGKQYTSNKKAAIENLYVQQQKSSLKKSKL